MTTTFLNLPNLISLLRLPLALLFLIQGVYFRFFVLAIATLSDGLDGFLARRYKQTTRFGALLDPIMDRFFVFFVLLVFMREGRIELWQIFALLCRDLALILFGIYLAISGRLTRCRFGAIFCGKATTFLQFLLFFALMCNVAVPFYVYGLFMALGVFALIELSLRNDLY